MMQLCLDFVNFMKDHVCTNAFTTAIAFLVLIVGILSTGYAIFWLVNKYLSLWLAPLGQTSPLAWMILLMQLYKKYDLNMLMILVGSSLIYLAFAVLGEQLLQESKNSDSSKSKLLVLGAFGLTLWVLVFRNLFDLFFQDIVKPPLPRG